MNRAPLRWDLFCRVVDNYGDAAVCGRLARQLAVEHGGSVRLWIDRPQTLLALQADLAPVAVRPWGDGVEFGEPADIAIDAFDAGLPEAYAARMSARSLWIKLEYLSAEPWVEAHHGLPSPHPTMPVRRFFFFPGFSERTGGLLRESDLLSKRDAFERGAFWGSLGFPPSSPDATVVSLFGYENAAAGELLRAWSDGPRPVVAAITECPLRIAAQEFLAGAARRGNLEARFLPFLPQARYDELLWTCDWNFVRGEDSFVRAQWAAKPFVWQPYPQQQDAHRVKLDAFLDLYRAGLEAPPLGDLWRAWNGFGSHVSEAWEAVQALRPGLEAHARAWAGRLAVAGELAGKLARFCENLLK